MSGRRGRRSNNRSVSPALRRLGAVAIAGALVGATGVSLAGLDAADAETGTTHGAADGSGEGGDGADGHA